MAIKERKQITGTAAQINGFAGHNGVLAYSTDTKHLHVLSGTAGTTTELANRTDIPDISGKADRTYVDTELAKKQAKGDYATNTALTQSLAGKANSSHTHTSADVTDLSNALKPYATTNMVNIELAKKANESHTHTVSQITDMPKIVLTVNGNGPDGSGNVSVPTGVTPNAYVTSTWKNGTAWYRKWSDGFIEQSGAFSGNGARIVNLNTPFSTTTYVVFVNTTNDTEHWLKTVPERNTSTFKVELKDTRIFGYYWYACGY